MKKQKTSEEEKKKQRKLTQDFLNNRTALTVIDLWSGITMMSFSLVRRCLGSHPKNPSCPNQKKKKELVSAFMARI